MEARDRGYTLYKKGMKYKEIAERIGVPLNTVKSWATRYWKDGKVATKAKPATKPEVATSPRKAGAPKGNVNAVGNKGGAPFECHEARRIFNDMGKQPHRSRKRGPGRA